MEDYADFIDIENYLNNVDEREFVAEFADYEGDFK